MVVSSGTAAAASSGAALVVRRSCGDPWTAVKPHLEALHRWCHGQGGSGSTQAVAGHSVLLGQVYWARWLGL